METLPSIFDYGKRHKIFPIIFLDFDGVVNTIYYRFYERDNQYKFRYANSADDFVNNEQAIQWLNELYRNYPFDIVITSTWRTHCNYRRILYNSGLNMKISILGCTPSISGAERGDEIAQWIIDNKERDANIIILDDDTDMSVMKSNLVKCDPYLGFTIYQYQECLKRMKQFEEWRINNG